MAFASCDMTVLVVLRGGACEEVLGSGIRLAKVECGRGIFAQVGLGCASVGSGRRSTSS